MCQVSVVVLFPGQWVLWCMDCRQTHDASNRSAGKVAVIAPPNKSLVQVLDMRRILRLGWPVEERETEERTGGPGDREQEKAVT